MRSLVASRVLVSPRDIFSLQVNRGRNRDSPRVARLPTEPKVKGSNPLGRVTEALLLQGFYLSETGARLDEVQDHSAGPN